MVGNIKEENGSSTLTPVSNMRFNGQVVNTWYHNGVIVFGGGMTVKYYDYDGTLLKVEKITSADSLLEYVPEAGEYEFLGWSTKKGGRVINKSTAAGLYSNGSERWLYARRFISKLVNVGAIDSGSVYTFDEECEKAYVVCCSTISDGSGKGETLSARMNASFIKGDYSQGKMTDHGKIQTDAIEGGERCVFLISVENPRKGDKIIFDDIYHNGTACNVVLGLNSLEYIVVNSGKSATCNNGNDKFEYFGIGGAQNTIEAEGVEQKQYYTDYVGNQYSAMWVNAYQWISGYSMQVKCDSILVVINNYYNVYV